jgi:hypothetical protein
LRFDASRVRRGEWVAGASALLLLASTFLLNWSGSVNGWRGLTHLRWLVLLACLAGLALLLLQATRRTPALPAAFSVIVTVLGGLTVLALAYRVLIDPPAGSERAGAYLGLVCAIALAYGGFASLRTEGIAERDGPGEIETVRLGGDVDRS